MNKPEVVTIIAQETQPRLDRFLAVSYPEYSRTYLQGLVRTGCVTVNGKKETCVRTSLELGDVVGMQHIPRPGFNLEPQKVDFEVVDTQDDFIVVNKPAGLLVHAPANRSQEVTLVNGLLYLFKDLEELLKKDDRPGIVHRLDEHTSGLLLIARNERGKMGLTKLFHDRKISKIYKAIVRGHTPPQGVINFPIGRHPTIRTKMSHQGVEGRPATSIFTKREYLNDATLLDVKIVTGRTHQIRVHCAAIGHGVLGDALYGTTTPHISRQALHASILEFFYNGVAYRYEIPLPQDMQDLIQKLGTAESASE